MNIDPVFHKDVFSRIAPEKRQRVIQAAAEEFSEKGFNAANINIIAERAGISVGSLYKYFETKTHLYLEVVNRGFAILEEAVQPVVTSDSSLTEKIDGIVDALFEGVRQYPLMNRLYNRFTSEGDSQRALELSSRLESVTSAAYTALMAQAKKEGLVKNPCDDKYLAFFMDNIFITLQFSLSSEYWKDRMKIYLGEDVLEHEKHIKAQVSLFLRGALGIDT